MLYARPQGGAGDAGWGVVRTVGTTVDTVRHYEDVGLLRPERNGREKRYTAEHAEAFQVIQELKSVGFTLEDIGLIFKLRESYGCGSQQLVDEVVQQFHAQIGSLQSQIAALQDRRDRLRGLLDEISAVTTA